MAKKRLYVAYGSNLNVQQMRLRCPTAKLVGTGIVEDHELQFKGAANHSYATIAENEGETVPVAVWELQARDEKALDRYAGYPSHYFKQDISVKMDNGEEVTGMVYIMDLKQKFGMPSAGYLMTVYDGYNDCELDMEYLKNAVMNNAVKFAAELSEELISAVKPKKQMSLFDFDDDGEDDSEDNDENNGEELDEEESDDRRYFFSQ